MNDFIKINESILDYEEYQKQVLLIKKLIEVIQKENLVPIGFELIKTSSSGYELEIEFYNYVLDLVLQIKMTKQGDEDFI